MRWILFILLLSLLSGCGGKQPEHTALPLPESYRIVYRLESYEAATRTSHIVFTAAKNQDGYYFSPGNGEEYLFLSAGEDQFAMYVKGAASVQYLPNAGVTFTAKNVEQFAQTVLLSTPLQQNISALHPIGEETVAGRSCLIYEEARASSPDGQAHSRYLIDGETGLVLEQHRRYLHHATGTETTYLLTCFLFETEDITLPQVA